MILNWFYNKYIKIILTYLSNIPIKKAQFKIIFTRMKKSMFPTICFDLNEYQTFPSFT